MVLMSEKPDTKYMKIAAAYGAKKPRACGTPIRCKKCGWTTKIRLKKGATLKALTCWSCGAVGQFERWTKHDQEHKPK
jgi:predicted RNA-binding Zn-ribbon protein involved in translation (DUF1610 family)